MAQRFITFSLTGGNRNFDRLEYVVQRICDVVVGRQGKPQAKTNSTEQDAWWGIDYQSNEYWIHPDPVIKGRYRFSGRLLNPEKIQALEVVFREFIGLNVIPDTDPDTPPVSNQK